MKRKYECERPPDTMRFSTRLPGTYCHTCEAGLSFYCWIFYRDMMKIKISENPTFPMKSINNKKLEED